MKCVNHHRKIQFIVYSGYNPKGEHNIPYLTVYGNFGKHINLVGNKCKKTDTTDRYDNNKIEIRKDLAL